MEKPSFGRFLRSVVGCLQAIAERIHYTGVELLHLTGQCVIVEIFEVIKNGKPYDNKRYITNIKQLPKEPFD
jgi:hypothetical protein